MGSSSAAIFRAVFGAPRREQRLRLLFAALFAVCFVVGDSFRDYGSLFAAFDEPPQAVRQLALLAACFLAAFIGIGLMSAAVKHFRDRGRVLSPPVRTWPVFLVLVLAWTPCVVCNFPGSVPYDTMNQINQGLGAGPLINHHPAIMSLYYGAVIQLARYGIGDIGGIFALTLMQMVFIAFVFAELVRFVDEVAQKRVLTLGAIAFFALYPTWPMMVQGIIKDTPYTGFFVLFALAYARCALAGPPGSRPAPKGIGAAPGKREFVMLALGALGMCFCRNNGIYVVVLSAVVLLLLKQVPKVRAREAAVFALVVVAFLLVTGPLYSAMGVQPGSVKEALSIPLQQVARYVSHYDAELSPGEREAINGVLDVKAVRDGYDPNLSDPVKDTFRNDASREQWRAFFEVSLALAQRHPEPFMEAPLHNSYRYYSFTDSGETRSRFQDYTMFKLNESLDYDDYLPFTKGARELAKGWARLVTSLPVLNLLNRCGFFTWVLLLCIYSALVRRQSREIVAALPLILSVLVCIASPVNGLQRYMWPVMAAVWISVALAIAGARRHDIAGGAGESRCSAPGRTSPRTTPTVVRYTAGNTNCSEKKWRLPTCQYHRTPQSASSCPSTTARPISRKPCAAPWASRSRISSSSASTMDPRMAL